MKMKSYIIFSWTFWIYHCTQWFIIYDLGLQTTPNIVNIWCAIFIAEYLRLYKRQNDENIIQWRIQVSHQKKCMISSSWQNDSTAADITSFHHTIWYRDPFFSVFGIGGSFLLRKHFYIMMMHKTRQRHVHSFWLNYPIAHSGRKRPKQPWLYRSQNVVN